MAVQFTLALKQLNSGMSRTISLIIGSILIGMACTVTGMTAAGLVISNGRDWAASWGVGGFQMSFMPTIGTQLSFRCY